MWDPISLRILLCRIRWLLLIPSPTYMHSVWCMSTICAMKCPFHPLRSCFLSCRMSMLMSSKSAASIPTPHFSIFSCCGHLRRQESNPTGRKRWSESTVSRFSAWRTRPTTQLALWAFAFPLTLVPHRVAHHHLHSPPLLPERFLPLPRRSAGHLLLLAQQVHLRFRRARGLLLGLQAHARRLGPAHCPAW